MTTTVNHAVEATRRWVTFCLAGERYGMDVMAVQEVLRVPEIVPVPGSPRFVLGIINLRGTVVTAVDARTCFGLDPKNIDEASRVVITECNKHLVGLLVDSVSEVVNLAANRIEAAPDSASEGSRCIQGIAYQNGELLILIDANRLLTAEQWNEVAVV